MEMMKLTKSGNYNYLSFCLCALICLSLQTYAETGHADCDDDGEGGIYKAVEFMFAWDMFNKANAQPADSNIVAQSMPQVKIVPAVADQNSLTMPEISITPPAISADSNAIKQLVPQIIAASPVLDQNSLAIPKISIALPAATDDINTVVQSLPQINSVPAPSDKNDALTVKNDMSSEQKPDAKVISHQLWKSTIAVSNDTGAIKSKTEMNSLINQIGSIEFKAKEPAIAEPVAEDSNATKTEPNLPNKKISDKTIAKLQELLKTPEQLPNPLELGEILFTSGHFVEAATCYRQALERMMKEEIVSPEDKGWILLQIGNSLQHSDPQAALENYRSVINEQPGSHWKQQAQAKIDLLEWYQKDMPESLIKQSKL
jgi:tetratricopeptide (TPR) repeat protein